MIILNLLNLAFIALFTRYSLRQIHIRTNPLTTISIGMRNKIHDNISCIFHAYYTTEHQEKEKRKIHFQSREGGSPLQELHTE